MPSHSSGRPGRAVGPLAQTGNPPPAIRHECFRRVKRPPKRKSGQSRGGIVLAQMLAPGNPSGSIGIAGRCPVCERVSANLVSPEHVDLPFHNDAEIGVVEHVFPGDAERAIDEFRAELWSGSFGARRLPL